MRGHWAQSGRFRCGLRVPEVLLSGHLANIERWRMEQSVERTMKKRPDMLK